MRRPPTSSSTRRARFEELHCRLVAERRSARRRRSVEHERHLPQQPADRSRQGATGGDRLRIGRVELMVERKTAGDLGWPGTGTAGRLQASLRPQVPRLYAPIKKRVRPALLADGRRRTMARGHTSASSPNAKSTRADRSSISVCVVAARQVRCRPIDPANSVSPTNERRAGSPHVFRTCRQTPPGQWPGRVVGPRVVGRRRRSPAPGE